MNEIREIVTKAVVSKGKKIIRLTDTLTPINEAYSILGCWIINHEFEAALEEDKVVMNGTFEVNIWYAYDNNTRTDIAKKTCYYVNTVKTRQIVQEVSSTNRDVIVRVLQQPTCTNAIINDDKIKVDVILELIAEIIGETKMKVTVFCQVDPSDPYEVEDFENEINEDFLNEEVNR